MAGDTAELARPWIVDLAPQHHAIVKLGRRRTPALALIRMEGGVPERERPEHDAGEIVVERVATHPADDFAEQNEAGIAVLEAGAGRVVERLGGQRPGGTRKATGQRVGGGDRRESGTVREDPADRHLLERASFELLEVA